MSNYTNNFSINSVKSSKIAILVAALVIFAVMPALVQAAVPAEQWNKTFGGILDDSANSVQKTSDGGYIIAGTTSSYGAGGFDAWLIKVDSSGNQIWNKTFGGTLDDKANSVQKTSDEGYIIAGTTSSYGAGGSDAWLIKVDSSGNQSWNKTFGGTLDDSANSVQKTADGGYIIAATNSSYDSIMGAAWLIKVDSNGNQQWNNTFFKTDDSNTDYQASSVSQTSEGGYIIAGWVEMPAANDNFWLSKVDSSGNQIWSKTYNGFAGGYDQAHSVQQTSEGGYILAGVAGGDMGDPDAAWLVKTDSNGNITWDKRFGGGNETDVSGCAYSVQLTGDGGYIIAGTTRSYGAGSEDNAWLIKVDSNGNQQWNKTFGETLDDSANSVQQTSDGGYIIAGETMSYGAGSEDAWLIKVAPDISTISSMTPTHDNRLRQSSPNTVLSSTAYLDIGKSAYRCRDVMLFDLSMYNNTTISKATLSLYWYYPAGATRTSDTVVEVYRPMQWDPQYVTWNSRMSGTPWDTAGGNWFDKNGVDQGTTPYASVTFPASVVPDNRYYEFDVTELVQEYVSGDYDNTGFFLKAKTESSNYIAFYSSDWSNADQRPKLTITTTSVTVDNPPVAEAGPNQIATTGSVVTFNGSASTDDKGIVSYSWDFDAADGITTEATEVMVTKTYATAGNYTVTLTVTDNGGQNDSDTMQAVVGSQVTTIAYTPEYDNRLRQSSPNTVLSSTDYLDIGKSAYRCRDVMLFDLSMYNNTTISKATLSLYWYYPAGATRTSDTVVEVYRPMQWDPQYVTWNSRMSGTPWDTAGGNWFDKNGVDQGTTPYASVTFPASVVPDNRYYEFDVTELVQEYVSGDYDNTGFFLKAKAEGGNYIAFYSSEWPNVDQRPKLTITSS
ncbi:PDK repeat-containing protein (plasmid) [Methanomethylovorans hollandica DSM 15978]|uniref:PDK repeat-containing protein n=1 Tax=Methanomethylovorans hollandica (strain DSM 15978 / NBRC 107637 / DMS1) TaxID=867904 RepID=L0L1C6_METHD|nr:PDK repeat-containing protein [Methanomethylovorans hollandica DSM 15978]